MNDLQEMIDGLLEAHQVKVAKQEREWAASLAAKREEAAAAWAELKLNAIKQFPAVLHAYLSLVDPNESLPSGWQKMILDAPGLANVKFLMTVQREEESYVPFWREAFVGQAYEQNHNGWEYPSNGFGIGEYEITADGLKSILTRAAANWPSIKAIQDEKAGMEARNEAFRSAYIAYMKERDQVNKANDELAASLQQWVDGQMGYGQTWTLHYGIKAEEEGELYASTESVEVLRPEPVNGAWLVVHSNGLICPTRFFAPAFIEDEPSVQDGHYYRAKYLLPGTQTVIRYPAEMGSNEMITTLKERWEKMALPCPGLPKSADFGFDTSKYLDWDIVNGLVMWCEEEGY